MTTLEGKRIFIVEDNVMNLAVFSTALCRFGAAIFQDAWGDQTKLALLSHLPIDVIIMDLMLKDGISGYDVFDQIQGHSKLKNIPVVAVSSLDPETEIPKLKAKGFVGFISKPIQALTFPEQILACINGEGVWITER